MGTEQKVAVITGASQGFGAGLVKAYRDRNYRVIANSRSIKPSKDSDVLTIAGDVADPKTADRIVQEGLARFGRIDTLINNAGIFAAKPLIEYTEEDFASILATNLGGFFRVTKRVAAEMLKQGSGHIVQITTSLIDHAGSNGVHPNSLFCVLDRQGLRGRVQPTFGHRGKDRGNVAVGVIDKAGRNLHNVTRPLLQHFGGDALGDPEEAAKIDRYDRSVIVLGIINQRLCDEDSSIVDEGVDASETCQTFRD